MTDLDLTNPLPLSTKLGGRGFFIIRISFILNITVGIANAYYLKTNEQNGFIS